MIKQFKRQGVNWIDIEAPNKEDILKLANEYNLHSLVVDELLSESHQSHIDVYDKYLYLVLHFPTCEVCYGTKGKDSQEIDIILGREFLITIHYEPIQTLEEFSKIFDAQFKLGDNRSNFYAGYLFHHIMRGMYSSLELGMEFINDELKRIQKKVFAGKEKEMVLALSEVNRNLLDFRWALKAHVKILSDLELAVGDFFDGKFTHHIRSITGQFNKIWEMLEGNREVFQEIKETNDSLLNIKTNEVMKTLTLLAFITFPLSVFTSTFGMNTLYTPVLGQKYDFWIIVSIMIISVSLMFVFFKYKKWL